MVFGLYDFAPGDIGNAANIAQGLPQRPLISGKFREVPAVH